MKTSVIIPSLNTPTLVRALEAINRQTILPDEVVVVGRDVDGVLADWGAVTFVDTAIPVGAAAARNFGIRATDGELLLFCDADCVPRDDWLESHLARHQAGALVVGGGVALEGENYWAQSDNVSMFHEFVIQQPAQSDRFMLPTLNLSVRREVIDNVGLMDETFPGAAGEDSDWTIRMRLAGYRLVFEPKAVVAHKPARTRWQDVVRHWQGMGQGGVRVRLRYVEEYGTPGWARSALWWRILAPLIAVKITAGIYAQPIFWRYWMSLPVVYITKVIYCWSAARTIAAGGTD